MGVVLTPQGPVCAGVPEAAHVPELSGAARAAALQPVPLRGACRRSRGWRRAGCLVRYAPAHGHHWYGPVVASVHCSPLVLWAFWACCGILLLPFSLKRLPWCPVMLLLFRVKVQCVLCIGMIYFSWIFNLGHVLQIVYRLVLDNFQAPSPTQFCGLPVLYIASEQAMRQSLRCSKALFLLCAAQAAAKEVAISDTTCALQASTHGRQQAPASRAPRPRSSRP